jgi:hypothetical protein
MPEAPPKRPPIQLLRCPIGHGLQWFREQHRLSSLGSSEDNFKCSICSSQASSSKGFHTCASCFRDTGMRHIVCCSCSKLSSEADTASATNSKSSRLKNSASAGQLLPPAHAPRILTSSASDWSLVSAAASHEPTVGSSLRRKELW